MELLMLKKIALGAAFVLAFTGGNAHAGGFTDRDFQDLVVQVRKQQRQIASLERRDARQQAELAWFRECTPSPMNIGNVLDLYVGHYFESLGRHWDPVKTVGLYTMALQPHCTGETISGFPFGRLPVAP
jgi:hypothetical protein